MVGVAALELSSGRSLELRPDEVFPTQSVFKLPVAIEVLSQIDARRLTLNQTVTLEFADARKRRAKTCGARLLAVPPGSTSLRFIGLLPPAVEPTLEAPHTEQSANCRDDGADNDRQRDQRYERKKGNVLGGLDSAHIRSLFCLCRTTCARESASTRTKATLADRRVRRA
jgi:hypothetical protein